MKRIGHNSKVGVVLLTDRRDFVPMDRSAFSQKLINSGSTWRLDGRGYDGTDDYIDVGAGVSATTAITVSMWYRTQIGTANKYWIQSYNNRIIIYTSASNVLSFGVMNEAGASATASTGINSALFSGNWCHVVGMYSITDGYVRIYINGILIGSTAQSGLIKSSIGENIYIGSYRGTQNFFSGTNNKVSIKNFAEYAARIQRSSMTGGLRGRDGMRRAGG